MRWIVVVVVAGCGRVGFDPLGGVAGDDAPGSGSGSNTGTCNSASCASAGGTCSNGTCVINVNGTGPVMCPAGETCVINCNVVGACNNGIDCSMAAHCTVDCKADMTCTGTSLSCGGTGCQTYCRVSNTCNNVSFMCAMASLCINDCCGSNLLCNGLSGNHQTHMPPTCP